MSWHGSVSANQPGDEDHDQNIVRAHVFMRLSLQIQQEFGGIDSGLMIFFVVFLLTIQSQFLEQNIQSDSPLYPLVFSLRKFDSQSAGAAVKGMKLNEGITSCRSRCAKAAIRMQVRHTADLRGREDVVGRHAEGKEAGPPMGVLQSPGREGIRSDGWEM